MLEWAKKLFWRIVFLMYSLIFRKTPGPVAQRFVKSLGFVFSGMVLSKVFSFIFQVMSGRVLGRVEYGKFALANSIASILWTFMYLAIGTAMVKYLASSKTERERTAIISTGIMLTIVATVLFSLLFYILSVPLASAFSVSLPYMFAAIALSVSLNIWTYAQKVAQGLDRMKTLSLINILWSLVMLLVSMGLYLYTRTAIASILATIIGYLISSLLIAPDMKRHFRFRVDRAWAGTIMKYSLIAVLGTVSFTTLGAINKIFLNIFLSIGDVGMYQAYYYSTIVLAFFLVTVFSMVFFPESSRYRNKPELFSRMNRFMKTAPVFYVMFLAASSVILFLYGSEYTFILPLLMLFVLASVISSMESTYNWFAASFGISGIKITSVSVGIICITDIAAALLLIPPYGLYGAVCSMVIAYFLGGVFIYSATRRLISRGDYS